MRGSSQSGLVPVKASNGPTISDKERVKERWAEHIESKFNQYRLKGKDIEESQKVCDTFDVKEDLFCDEELSTVLERLKIIRLQVQIVW